MSRYRISHVTGFKYGNEVTTSYNEARLLPIRDDRQFVISSKLDVQPSGSAIEYQDYFKTRVIQFEVLEQELHAFLLGAFAEEGK